MKFEDVFEQLLNGRKLFRSDRKEWGYSVDAYIFTEDFQYEPRAWIRGKYDSSSDLEEQYDFSFADLISDKWEFYNDAE